MNYPYFTAEQAGQSRQKKGNFNMSLQAALNADSMDSIPRIKEIIANADTFEANQMEQKALREMMNSPVAIVNMSSEELDKFQTDLIEVFAYHDWI